MSRLHVLKLCSIMMRDIKMPKSILSRFHPKHGDRLNSVVYRRGYTQYSWQLASVSRIYPLYRLLDRVFSEHCPAKLSTTTREEYRKYDNKRHRRHYKHLGMLLSGFGFIVALCDAPNLAGI